MEVFISTKLNGKTRNQDRLQNSPYYCVGPLYGRERSLKGLKRMKIKSGRARARVRGASRARGNAWFPYFSLRENPKWLGSL